MVISITAAVLAVIKSRETTAVLATSDLRRGGPLADNFETASEGISYLARAARAGDSLAQTRLWTMLQQRSFWLPAATVPTPTDDEPAVPSVPQEVLDRFSSVDVNGKPQKPQNIAISRDGKRVFTAVGEPHDVPAMMKVWNIDGTAVTDWRKPPYNGQQWLNRVRGYFNATGRYLAVELEGWRETATLIVYDLETMQQLQTDITASGLLPQTQSIGFNAVQFVERPAKDGTTALTFLVTASAKGDAAVYWLDDGRFIEVARNSHRSSVRVASIDTDYQEQWLMSAGQDGTVSISTLKVSPLNTFRPVGNLIYADSPPTALRRNGASGLLVKNDGGRWVAYDLKSPVKRKPVEVPALQKTDPAHQEACLRLIDPYGKPETRLEHPSGLVLTAATNRQVGVARAGEAAKLSPLFTADIGVICAANDGSIVTVTTTDFRTEIWKSDFSERLGLILDEAAYFGAGLMPEKTDWVEISPDGQRAMIRSSFWDPPNVEVFWISLWDIQTGLPLMDRTKFATDGLTDRQVQSARFATDGHITFIGDEALAPQSLEVSPPAAFSQTLPQYVEALVNRSINAQGLPERIPDRADRLAAGNQLLESMGE
jgi:WD40 repeat protein